MDVHGGGERAVTRQNLCLLFISILSLRRVSLTRWWSPVSVVAAWGAQTLTGLVGNTPGNLGFSHFGAVTRIGDSTYGTSRRLRAHGPGVIEYVT